MSYTELVTHLCLSSYPTVPVFISLIIAADAVVEDPKDKGAKGKDKKKKGRDSTTTGLTDAPPSSFQTAEKAVNDLINLWSKDTFRLNRVLYDKDEMLCMLIERAIWHEVERLKEGMFTIKKLVLDQTMWLQRTEASLQRLLTEQIATRYCNITIS